jgi:hypothetical protein
MDELRRRERLCWAVSCVVFFSAGTTGKNDEMSVEGIFLLKIQG